MRKLGNRRPLSGRPTQRSCVPGRCESGFTLPELLLALLISLTALLLASRLLVESQARMSHAARRALDPVGEIAARTLRADLRAASGVVAAPSNLWSRDPLVVAGHPGGALSFAKVGDELRRVASSDRIVLRSVTTFRWRVRGGTVEIDLRHRSTPRWGRLTSGGVREAPASAEERLLLRIAPRGDGGRRW